MGSIERIQNVARRVAKWHAAGHQVVVVPSAMSGETNRLRVDCIGNRLSLYVNGEIVAEVTDGDLASGDVGLASGTYDDPGTDMRFDNFVVYRP